MKIQSLIFEKNALIPVEVELTLWPGLPGIQFLGLPDQHLKESALRIKSAIKAAGFQFPIAQQILVNLRPSHLKKTSRGLELAVAAAYLWETGQVVPPVLGSEYFVYGELTLHGDVLEPEDLGPQFSQQRAVVLTGTSSVDSLAPFRRHSIGNLSELATPEEKLAQEIKSPLIRPKEFALQKYSKAQSKLIQILATGEHSALLAGAAGSGKTTVAKSLPAFLRAPEHQKFQELRKIHFEFGHDLTWRPVVKPHHSTPMMAMIGGGSVPFAGEISRAHGGVLILDELLEFAGPVQEALREPFEEGKMRVLRSGKMKEYLAEAQIIATSNLCKCGQWTPSKARTIQCRFNQSQCRGYSQKLSGPLIDRFDMITYVERIGELNQDAEEIFKRVEAAQEFSLSLHGDWIPNGRRPLHQILKTVQRKALRSSDVDNMESQRRKVATFRVARTIADLHLAEEVTPAHINEALEYTKINFERLARWS